MSNDVISNIQRAMTKAADKALDKMTDEQVDVCLIRARKVFETAEHFKLSQFISLDDKAGFVVWSAMGTPYKTARVGQFIDGIVSQAKADYMARAATAKTAA